MSPELYRRARRAEAGADRAEDRRRLRLEFFRAVLAEGLDSLKAMHAEGASGQESVRAHARLVDELVRALTRMIVDDARAAGATPTPYVVVALGGYGRGELHPSSDIDLMVVYDGAPNVKESAGGLRDMHTAMWLGAAKFGARTLRELADRGLITPREQAGADAALTFLWRVRNELHFFSGHKNDVLTRDLQPRIGKNLGYENEGDTLGVERC